MKLNALLGASLMANVLLVSAGAYLLKQEHDDSAFVPPLVVCIPQPAPAALAAPGADTTAAITRQKTIEFGRIESDDYRRYIAQLRNLGYPPEGIRRIISADVNDLFHWRAGTQVATANLNKP
jgi:hypothetical protein